MIDLMRSAFREVGRDHLAALFRFHSIEEIINEHHQVFAQDKARRQATHKLETVRQLASVWSDDQAMIYAAVAAVAGPLATPIREQVDGTASGHGRQSAKNLPAGGYVLFGMAERELVDLDAHMLWVRLQEIIDLPNYYKTRFRGNFQYYVDGLSKTIHTFLLDFGPITPVMLQHALMIPIMLRLGGGSEEAWRKKLKTLDEWDEAAASYDVLVQKIASWSENLMDFQRNEYKSLFNLQPLSKGAHAVKEGIKPRGELVLFARNDTASTCSDCGQKHGGDVPCLTAENMKRLSDELTPQTAILKAVVKDLGKAAAGQTTAEPSIKKLNQLVKALEASAFRKTGGKWGKRGAGTTPKRESVNKAETQGGDQADAGDQSFTSPEFVAKFSETLKAAVKEMVAPQGGGGARGGTSGAQGQRSRSDVDVVYPKGLESGECYDHAVKGRKCERSGCTFKHDRENEVEPVPCGVKGCDKPVLKLRDRCAEHTTKGGAAAKGGGARKERTNTAAAAEAKAEVKHVEDLMSLLVKMAPERLHVILPKEDEEGQDSTIGLGPDALCEASWLLYEEETVWDDIVNPASTTIKVEMPRMVPYSNQDGVEMRDSKADYLNTVFVAWATVWRDRVFKSDELVHHERRRQAARDRIQTATESLRSREDQVEDVEEVVAKEAGRHKRRSKLATAMGRTRRKRGKQERKAKARADDASRSLHEARRKAERKADRVARSERRSVKEMILGRRAAAVDGEHVPQAAYARLAGLRGEEASLGLQWRKMPEAEALTGKELIHPQLAKALKTKTNFTMEGWLRLKVDGVVSNNYIKSGESYFTPIRTRATKEVQERMRTHQAEGMSLPEARKAIKDAWVNDFSARVDVIRSGKIRHSAAAAGARTPKPRQRFGGARTRRRLIRIWDDVQSAAVAEQREELWGLWANNQFTKLPIDEGTSHGSAPDVILDEIWEKLGLQGQTVKQWFDSLQRVGIVERLAKAGLDQRYYRRYTMAQLGVKGEEHGIPEADASGADGGDLRSTPPQATEEPGGGADGAAGGDPGGDDGESLSSSSGSDPVGYYGESSSPPDTDDDNDTDTDDGALTTDVGNDSTEADDSDEELVPTLNGSSSSDADEASEEELDFDADAETVSVQQIIALATHIRDELAEVHDEMSRYEGLEARRHNLSLARDSANDMLAALGVDLGRQMGRSVNEESDECQDWCQLCQWWHGKSEACPKATPDGHDEDRAGGQKRGSTRPSRVHTCREEDTSGGDEDNGDADSESDDAGMSLAAARCKRKMRSARWERTGTLDVGGAASVVERARRTTWQPLATAGRLRGLRLADMVRAHVLIDDDGGVFLQQMLKDFKPKNVPGILYWLADSGSTCFVSDEREHILCAEECVMNITGVGATICKLRSQLVITTMDTAGDYNTMQYGRCYNTKGGVGFPIASTGAMARNGCKFNLDYDKPRYTTGGGRTIPLVTDAVTGFHFIVEHVKALPSIKLREWCLREAQVLHDDHSKDTHFRGKPSMYITSAEDKPGKAYATSIQAGEVTARCRGSRVWVFGKPKLKSNQLTKEWINGMSVGKQTRDISGNGPGDQGVQAHTTTEVEQTDDDYAKEVRKAGEEAGFKKPIRLKMPAIRLADTGQPKDIQKLQKYIHELFGHLELRKIFDAIDHIEGAEVIRILKVIIGHQGGSDAHCDSCEQNKTSLPPMPRGKTERPFWIREVKKIYVDLLGYVKEPSVFHNYHFAMAAVTDGDFGDIIGLAYRAQSLLGMSKIFGKLGGVPGEIQIDGESTLNTEPAKLWMSGKGTGRSSKVTVTEAYAHWRNGKIERRWRTWKAMARCMLGRAGLGIGWWYHALKFAVTVTNIVNMVTDDADQPVTKDGKPVTAWELHFGEKPRLQEILLGPFGSLAYLILSEEQRRARGQSGSFGVRAIVGIYLGPEVDPKTGVYHHLVTDGKTIYASPNNVKIIPDVYPAEFSPDRESTAITGRDERVLVGLEEPEADGATARDFYERAYVSAVKEAAREEQERMHFAKQDGEELYAARKTAMKRKDGGAGDKRRTGQGKKKAYQVAGGKDGGPDAQYGTALELGDDPNKEVNFETVEDYRVEPLADEYEFVKPYDDAKYCIAVTKDFKNEDQVGKPLAHPHDRFVGRRVRKAFTVNDKKGKEVSKNFEGRVASYSSPRQLFNVEYDDVDREEYDFQQLMDLLIMGAKYGDSDDDSGNTRAERVEALKYAALYLEMQEELWAAIQTKACMHSHDAYDRYEESVNEQALNAMTSKQEPGTLHVPVTDGKAPIYDDEPNNQKELEAHPEKKEILASSAAEMRQLVEMDIGVLQTPQEVDRLIRDGVKILRSRMIYKRKYALSKTTNREEFLKWKSRLAVNGAGQTEGVDTVWNTFSPTIGFAAIRTLIATLCNPKYVTESFDLSGAFLGTKLEDHAVYVRLPPDAGEYAGCVLRLTKAVYGCKFSGAAFMKQLGDEVLKFEERVETTVRDPDGKTRKRVEYARFERLMTDQCIYRYVDTQGREMIFLSYVDDIICSTTDVDLRDRFFEHLQKTWKITKEGTLDRFLAVNFSRSKDRWSWRANMSSYISKIAARFGLTETRRYKTPMEPGFHLVEADFDEPPTEEMKTEMRSLIGSIGYATVALRYDTAYAVSVLSRYLAKPCKKVIEAAKRVIMYLTSTHDFYLECRSSEQEIEGGVANILVGAVDASFEADAMTRRSHGEYINFVNSGAVSWKSGLQPIVTLSSCEAEYVALCAEVCEVKYLRNLIEELGHEQKEATLIWEDNKAAILIAEQTGSSAGRCKHIDTRFRFVSAAIKDRVVRVRYTPTDTNVADLFTKPLTIAVFERLLELCRSTKSGQYGNALDQFQVGMGAAYFMVEGVWC